MTTEEERKAAAEKVESRKDELFAGYGPFSSAGTRQAVYLQVQLTRTEKRLEVAEGLLRDAYSTLRAYDIRQDSILEFLQSTSRGGVER